MGKTNPPINIFTLVFPLYSLGPPTDPTLHTAPVLTSHHYTLLTSANLAAWPQWSLAPVWPLSLDVLTFVHVTL